MRPFEHENGYEMSIRKGIDAVHTFRAGFSFGDGNRAENIARLKQALAEAEAVVVGAGAGLSASAGFTYSGERFERYFFDFREKFGITDMYAGGFYPFPDAETRWAWWARHIYFNRYVSDPKPVYATLMALLAQKDYFVITTNVDHRFQRAGIDKTRLFYTQGDYGLFQSARGRDGKTYDNEEWVMRAMAAQRFVRDEKGEFGVPRDRQIGMRLPHDLIPKTPRGEDVTMNLRSDDSFAEDEGWHNAAARYGTFLREHEGKRVLYLELGVGHNTPVIIKYPFWAMMAENARARYACVNFGETICPKEIADRAICVDGDIGEVLSALGD